MLADVLFCRCLSPPPQVFRLIRQVRGSQGRRTAEAEVAETVAGSARYLALPARRGQRQPSARA